MIKQLAQNTIERAVTCLNDGGVIAYPTEAVYGFGCDPFNVDAISKLLTIKRRSLDKGFILIASSWDQLESLVQPIQPRNLQRIMDSWPGPHTWVFPANPEVPKWLTGKHETLAIRVSNHPIVRALCQQYEGAIISTSANVEGSPPARDYRTVTMSFGDALDYIVEGKVGDQLKPTDIRDAVTGELIRK